MMQCTLKVHSGHVMTSKGTALIKKRRQITMISIISLMTGDVQVVPEWCNRLAGSSGWIRIVIFGSGM